MEASHGLKGRFHNVSRATNTTAAPETGEVLSWWPSTTSTLRAINAANSRPSSPHQAHRSKTMECSSIPRPNMKRST